MLPIEAPELGMMNVRNPIRTLILMLVGICFSVSAAEDASPSAKEKRSWLDKMKGVVGLGKKEEPKAAPAAPGPPPPAPKKVTPPSKPKPKAQSTKPKTKAKPTTPAPEKKKAEPDAKPKTPSTTESKPAKEPEAKPTASEAPKEAPKPEVAKAEASPPKESPKPTATAPESKPVAAEPKPKEAGKADMSLDSEFATLKKDDEAPTPAKPSVPTPSTSAATAPSTPPPAPPPPLPSANVAWQIFQHDGHDWVTAESMHSFYRFSEFKVSGDNVWFKNPTMILKGQVGRQDMLINNIKFVLSHPITMLEGKVCFSRIDLSKLLDPVIRPWLIGSPEMFDTVVLDAGHGGHDSGAKGIYGYEKDFTLQLAMSVRAALLKRGFKVVMTRQDDRFISLGGRAQFANTIPKSIFISLHFNSSGSSASGIETFALTPQGSSSTAMGQREWDSRAFTGNSRDAENIALATAVHAMVIHRYKLIDRGIKRARWSVLTGCTRPGILFEGGFVTNEKDGRLIASPLYREGLAAAIGDALLNYRAALHPRTAQRPSR